MFDWDNYTIAWRGGLFQMNPNPEDYGGEDMRGFFLEQYVYMINTGEYDLIDQRLLNIFGDVPIKCLKPASNLEGVKQPKQKRKRKRKRKR